MDELTKVAQDLGAKHVEIVLKSMQKSAHRQNTSGSFSARKASFKLGAEMSSSSSKNEYNGVEVAAKIDFSGNNNPVKPKLVYFKNESDIKALIDMRLNPNNNNSILSKTYTLQYGNSSGIKVSDAQKIDLALSQLNCSVGRSVASEAVSENSTILEYSIAF